MRDQQHRGLSLRRQVPVTEVYGEEKYNCIIPTHGEEKHLI